MDAKHWTIFGNRTLKKGHSYYSFEFDCYSTSSNPQDRAEESTNRSEEPNNSESHGQAVTLESCQPGQESEVILPESETISEEKVNSDIIQTAHDKNNEDLIEENCDENRSVSAAAASELLSKNSGAVTIAKCDNTSQHNNAQKPTERDTQRSSDSGQESAVQDLKEDPLALTLSDAELRSSFQSLPLFEDIDSLLENSEASSTQVTNKLHNSTSSFYMHLIHIISCNL